MKMNTALFLCLIGFTLSVTNGQGSKYGVFKGSPKVRERDVKKVDSAKGCAEACDNRKKCLFWEFTKKTKNCKISVLRIKESKKASSGLQNCKSSIDVPTTSCPPPPTCPTCPPPSTNTSVTTTSCPPPTTCPSCPTPTTSPPPTTCPSCPTSTTSPPCTTCPPPTTSPTPTTCPTCPTCPSTTTCPPQTTSPTPTTYPPPTTCPSCPTCPSPPTTTSVSTTTCPPPTTCPPSTTCPPLTTYPSSCPSGWTKYSRTGSCYKILTTEANWDSQRNNCISNGAELASIRSSEEWTWVEGFLTNSEYQNTTVWLGGSDARVPDSWVWTDGSPVTFTAWQRYEPSRRSGEDCLVSSFNPGTWGDTFCSIHNNALCKIPAIVV